MIDTTVNFEQLYQQFNNLPISALEKRAEQLNHLELDSFYDQLILECLSYINVNEPDWTYVAAHLYLKKIYQQAAENRGYSGQAYGDFHTLIQQLSDLEIYSPILLSSYTKEEIDELGKEIVPERDQLFTYLGIKMLTDRYVAKDRQKRIFELPQERWMVIAMILMHQEEKIGCN